MGAPQPWCGSVPAGKIGLQSPSTVLGCRGGAMEGLWGGHEARRGGREVPKGGGMLILKCDSLASCTPKFAAGGAQMVPVKGPAVPWR